MDIKDITRRDFIQRLTLFGAAGVGAGSLLAACGGGEPVKEISMPSQVLAGSCLDGVRVVSS